MLAAQTHQPKPTQLSPATVHVAVLEVLCIVAPMQEAALWFGGGCRTTPIHPLRLQCDLEACLSVMVCWCTIPTINGPRSTCAFAGLQEPAMAYPLDDLAASPSVPAAAVVAEPTEELTPAPATPSSGSFSSSCPDCTPRPWRRSCQPSMLRGLCLTGSPKQRCGQTYVAYLSGTLDQLQAPSCSHLMATDLQQCIVISCLCIQHVCCSPHGHACRWSGHSSSLA